MARDDSIPNKAPIDLDWKFILGGNDGEPPPLEIVRPLPMNPRDEFLLSMSDQELEQKIKRQKANIGNMSSTLIDKGAKLRLNLKELENERERRRRRGLNKDIEEREKPTQSTSSDITCASSDGFRQKDVTSQVKPQSEFGFFLEKKMDENRDCSLSTSKAFDKELSELNPCNRQNRRSSGVFSQMKRQRCQPPRELPACTFYKPKSGLSACDLQGRATLIQPYCNGESMSTSLSKKSDSFQVRKSNPTSHNKRQELVLLDEDDSDLVEIIEHPKELSECVKVDKIHYPSRDHPESVEIAYQDLNCLSPTSFLTSPIMNFYIRYIQLQAPPTNKASRDYHLFNTFFYKKLEQAVKRSDDESDFGKFRRWWKGVNIFQKAYLLIPIHHDLHWSLVIICIPDMEDESGPIILHLDSLKLHSSKSVFNNIKSFLREEWEYMKEEVTCSDLPIADRIWKHLPRRIDEQVIPVPQQKNDFDCGMFVLFFMERFIEEAPGRLKKRDLQMFGKRWFRPEEASSLRGKIKDLLMDKFRNASEDD